MTPQYSEAKDIAAHEARLANLEEWVTRIDNRIFAVLLLVITQLAGIAALWFKK